MRLRVIANVIFWILAVVVIAYLTATYGDLILQIAKSVDYIRAAIAMVLIVFGMIITVLVWTRILHLLEPQRDVGTTRLFGIFGSAILAKYIPGGIWEVSGRTYLTHLVGYEMQTILVSIAYELILSSLAGLCVSVAFLGGLISGAGIAFNAAVAVQVSVAIIVSIILLFLPKTFLRIANMVLKKFNLAIAETNFLSGWRMLEIFAYYAIALTIMGIGYHVFVISAAPGGHIPILVSSGSYILALTLGVVVVFAPAGLGVREIILFSFLKNWLPLPLATFVSIGSRILTIGGDVVIFIISKLISAVPSGRAT